MSERKLQFTSHVQRVFDLARDEADKQGLNEINSEHLLLGLMREESSAAGQFLRELGLEAKAVQEFVSREPPFRRDAVVGLMVLDTNGTVLYRNPAAQAIIDQHEAGLSKALSGLSPEGETEIDIDGLSYLAATAHESGDKTIVILQAITHGDRVYQDWQALVNNMMHDLKSPAIALKGLAQLVELTAAPDEKVQRYVTRMVTAANDLIAKLNNLRVKEDITKMDFAPCDLKPAIDLAIAHLQGVADSKSVQIRFDFPTETCAVSGHESLLYQMVLNLLNNAIRYSPDGKEVTIELSRTETEIRLSIRDQGPGIPQDEIPHLFERFFRGNEAKSTHGAGLGLPIVKAIVDRHGGTISVKSIPGEGAEFIVVLPALQQEFTAPRT